MITRLDVLPLPIGSYYRSSPFGPRGPGFHAGLDLAAPTGTDIYAPISGVLFQAWDPSGGGWWSRILESGGGFVGMGHASAYVPPGGRSGVYVQAGELVARVGSTGASSGPHLHLAVSVNGGAYSDPDPMVRDAEVNNRHVGYVPPPKGTPGMTLDEAVALIVQRNDDIATANRLIQEANTGRWIQDAEQRTNAATLRAALLVATEVRDVLGPLYDHFGIELPKLNVNDTPRP